jgi:hypothetical protein
MPLTSTGLNKLSGLGAGQGRRHQRAGRQQLRLGRPINLDLQNLFSGATAAGKVQNVFMAEWSEVLMSIAGNWNASDSSGEGLSQSAALLGGASAVFCQSRVDTPKQHRSSRDKCDICDSSQIAIADYIF